MPLWNKRGRQWCLSALFALCGEFPRVTGDGRTLGENSEQQKSLMKCVHSNIQAQLHILNMTKNKHTQTVYDIQGGQLIEGKSSCDNTFNKGIWVLYICTNICFLMISKHELCYNQNKSQSINLNNKRLLSKWNHYFKSCVFPGFLILLYTARRCKYIWVVILNSF